MTGETISQTIYLNTLNVITRIDGEKMPVDTNISFIGTKAYSSIATRGNYYEKYYAYASEYNNSVIIHSSCAGVFDIYADSVKKNKQVSTTSGTTYLDYYNVGISVKTDDADWVSDDVKLCDEFGECIYKLPAGDYDSQSKTRKYTILLPENTDEEYYVKIDGEVYGDKVSAQNGKQLTSADFVTYKISLMKDSKPFSTSVCYKNGKVPVYIKTGDDGKAITHLLDTGKEYNVTVLGVTDSNTHTVDSTNTDLSIDYYTVTFFESKIVNEELSCNSSKKYSYVLCKGNLITLPENPLLDGYTFDGWNTTPFESGESTQTYYDFTNGISETTKLYAHYILPKVEINNLIRCDASGTVSSTGTYFTMPSLTISGYDKGNVIHSAQISGTNLSTVKLPSNENVTVSLSDSSTVTASNGYYTVSGIYTKEFTITFGSKVSQQDAADYLRGIVFAITENTNGSISVKVSEGVISSYKTPTITQTQAYDADDSWVIVTEIPAYDFGINGKTTKMYFTKSLTFYRPNKPGYGGFGIYGDVIFYIPAGVTITAQGAQGADGVWNGNGGGSGIYLIEGNSLTVYGEGTLNAYGGNGADATVGENGKNAGYGTSGVGGTGGRGAGGGGAGVSEVTVPTAATAEQEAPVWIFRQEFGMSKEMQVATAR